MLNPEPLVRRVDEPPVPGVDASTNGGETQSAFPAVSSTCSSDTFLSRRRSGSTCTWSWRSRWPQIDTLATPGTPVSRGAIVQRACTDISIGDTSFDESPTISTRFVDESGCSICGGFDTCGSACACVSRSPRPAAP